MSHSIDDQLADFKQKNLTVRLCTGLNKVLPFTPELVFYEDLEGAAELMAPGAGQAVADRARDLCGEAGPQKVLKIANTLDKADAGLSIYTGLTSAVRAYRAPTGEKANALESDSTQAMDAVLKGLGMSWMVHELFEGSFKEKISAFMELDSGKHLVAYYAAIEVGLPFTDNAATGTGNFVEKLFERYESGQIDKLAAVTGGTEAAEASKMAHALFGPVQGMVDKSKEYMGSIANVATEHAPKALDMADKVASVAATGADALPSWRFLGARLVAEYTLRKAIEEVGVTPAALEDAEAAETVTDIPAAVLSSASGAASSPPTPAPVARTTSGSSGSSSSGGSSMTMAFVAAALLLGGGVVVWTLSSSSGSTSNSSSATIGSGGGGGGGGGASDDGRSSDGSRGKSSGGSSGKSGGKRGR